MMKPWMAWCGCAFLLAGCGQSPVATPQPDDRSGSAHENSTAPIADPAALEPRIAGSSTESKRRKWMAEALQCERDEDFEQALVCWDQIVASSAEEFGDDAWQTTNARLARELVEVRSGFDFAARRQAVEIGSQEQEADLALQQERLDDALRLYDQALQTSVALWGADRHISLNLQAKRAVVLARQQRFDESAGELADVYQRRCEVLGKVHPDTVQTLSDWMLVEQQRGAWERAIQLGEQALPLWVQLYGESSPEVATHCVNLSVVQSEAGQFAAANERLQQALAIREQCFGRQSLEVGHCLQNLANVHLSQQEAAQADQTAAAAIDIFLADGSVVVPLAKMQIVRGTVAMLNEDWAGAEGFFREARQTLDDGQDLWPLPFAEACFKLGVALGRQGKYPQAEIQLKLAQELQSQWLPEHAPELQQTRQVYQVVQQKLQSIRVGARPGADRF